MSAMILVVDDDKSMCELIASALARRGMEVIWETSAADGLARIDERDFQTVVTDLKLRGSDGIELCQRILERRPGLPVIAITAFGSMETAIEAIRAGAYDFITKPLDVDVLALAVERAVQHYELQQEVARLRRAAETHESFGDLVGTSEPMRELYDVLERVAGTDATLLITGETGTGKELVARAIHQKSGYRDGPFVAVNCAALPPTLLESEFFGHEKGAFTDAKHAHAGIFEQADGGTVFLDEIGELPLELQPKLLRVLQERVVRRLGGSKDVPFDARILAATNRDLEASVKAGDFREDLLYRINVIRVDVPPLRVRGNDILQLAQRFLERLASRGKREIVGIDPSAAERLMSYSWPGNVRELENCVERAVALARHDRIVVDDLPERIRDNRSSRMAIEDTADLLPMHEIERRYILKVLEAFGGNKRQAAKTLGLDRKTLWRKLKQYGVS